MCVPDSNLHHSTESLNSNEEEKEEERVFSNIEHPLSQISMGESSAQEIILTEPLRKRPHLLNGHLSNGLQYVLLPNKHPPNLIEARIEVKAGSMNEEDDEQGLAHFLEHVVFLGTEKFKDSDEIRKRLADWGMSFGPDANAYTNFRNTMYELIVPVSEQEELRKKETFNVLEMLKELTLKATFPPDIMEIEKQVVLSECSNFQSPDHRIFFQNTQQTHGNNILSKRFPIGLEEQIKGFTPQQAKRFYKRYYRCDNMVLYLCGAVNEHSIPIIEQVFGSEENPKEELKKLEAPEVTPATRFLSIFQLDLTTKFTLQINQRAKLVPITTIGDIREDLIISILGMALDNRIDTIRHQHSNPPFSEISWNYYEDTAMNCLCTDLLVSCQPLEWKEALRIMIREFVRLVLYGLTEEEMKEQLGVVLKDSHDLAEQNNTRTSAELIAEMIDTTNTRNTYIDRKQEYIYQMKLAPTISLSDVNTKAKSLFSWISSFLDGKLEKNPFISIFVSAPTSIKGTHKDSLQNSPIVEIPSPISSFGKSEEESNTLQVPTGKFKRLQELVHHSPSSTHSSPSSRRRTEMIPFHITEDQVLSEIEEALKDVQHQIEELAPLELLESGEIEKKMKETKPHWVPPNIKNCKEQFKMSSDGLEAKSENGIVLRKLWNGIGINMKKTDYEARWVSMRIHARGGISLEKENDLGCTSLGMYTFINGGAGGKSNEELQKYCNFYGISTDFDVSLESVSIDFGFSVSHEGSRRAFELLYLFLTRPDFRQKSFELGRKHKMLDLEETELEVEDVAWDNLVKMLYLDQQKQNPDPRFHRRTKEDLLSVDLNRAKEIALNHLVTDNLEVSIVGDFNERELLQLIERYLGVLPISTSSISSNLDPSVSFSPEFKLQTEVIIDDEERAFAYIGFPSVNRWTNTKMLADSLGKNLPKSSHLLYCSRGLTIVSRLISNRLYSEIREKKGLTYDISASLVLYEILQGGIFIISFMAFANKFEISYNEIMLCLQEAKAKGFTQSELDEVVNPMVHSIKTALSTNSFWLTTMVGLQRSCSPKHINCTNNIPEFYEELTLDDIQFLLANYISLEPYCVSIALTQKQ